MEKMVSSRLSGIAVALAGIFSAAGSLFWIISALLAVATNKVPAISHWWGLLVVPIGIWGWLETIRIAGWEKRFDLQFNGPVREVHSFLKSEFPAPSGAVKLFRNLSSEFKGTFLIGEIFFVQVAECFAGSLPNSATSDPQGSIPEASHRSPTGIELYRKGFLEAFGAFTFRTVPFTLGILVMIAVLIALALALLPR